MFVRSIYVKYRITLHYNFKYSLIPVLTLTQTERILLVKKIYGTLERQTVLCFIYAKILGTSLNI